MTATLTLTLAIDQQTAAATAAIELLGAGGLPTAQWALGLAQVDGARVVTAEGHLADTGEEALNRWASALHRAQRTVTPAETRITGWFGQVPVIIRKPRNF